MTGPDGRSLSAWWRRLAPFSPRRFWLADWLVYRLDLTVLCTVSVPDDPWSRLVQSLVTHEPKLTTELASRIGVPPALLRARLRQAKDQGWLQSLDPDSWALSPLPRRMVRRTFRVLEAPRMVVPLSRAGIATAIPPGPPPLDAVAAAIALPEDEKQRRGFPLDVLQMPAAGSEFEHWRHVPVVAGERHHLLLIETSTDRLLGVPITAGEPESTPILDLEFPDIAPLLGITEPTREAWQAALAEQGLTGAEFQRDGVHLRLTGDAVRPRPDTWILAGPPHCRSAALIEG